MRVRESARSGSYAARFSPEQNGTSPRRHFPISRSWSWKTARSPPSSSSHAGADPAGCGRLRGPTVARPLPSRASSTTLPSAPTWREGSATSPAHCTSKTGLKVRCGGTRERAETGSWHESLPEGSLLRPPCARRLPPARSGPRSLFLSRTLATRSAGVLAPCGRRSDPAIPGGPRIESGTLTVNTASSGSFARTRFAPAFGSNGVPVSLTGAALVAAIAYSGTRPSGPSGFSGRVEEKDTRCSPSGASGVGSRRARRGRTAGSGSASPRVAMSSRSPSQSWRSTP